MNCIILYRINGGPVRAVINGSAEIFEFPNMDAAVSHATDDTESNHFARLVASGQADYQIVELNEL